MIGIGLELGMASVGASPIPSNGLTLSLTPDTGLAGGITWTDLSGKGNSFVAFANSPTHAPTVNPTGINGRQAMQGNATSIMTGPAGSALATTAAERIMVLLPDYTSGVAFDSGWGGGGTEYFGFTDNNIYTDFFSVTRISFAPGVAGGTPIVLDTASGGGLLQAWVNGTSQYSAANVFSVPTSVGMFGNGGTWRVGPVYVWNRILSAAERAAVTSYLLSLY